MAHLDDLRRRRVIEVERHASGTIRIAGRNFCGRFRMPSGQVVEIGSKIPLLPLIEWLAFTDTIPQLDEWTSGATLGHVGSFVDAIARFYIDELAQLTKFHWRHGYQVARAVTADFRGRLDVRQLARSIHRLPSIPCAFRERTMDTQANRVLARALDAVWRLAKIEALPEHTRRNLDWLTHQWGDIARDVPSITQAIGDTISRPPVGYLRALQLARLIMQGVAVDPAGGDGGDTFLVNMSAVWEEGLRRMLRSWADAHGLAVGEAEDRTRPWDDATGRDQPNRWLTVDAMLATERPIVFDAKYKRGFGDESRSDRFQMAAYAMRFGAVAAVLVYPTGTDEPSYRRLMRASAQGEFSDIAAVEFPMALGPQLCQEAARTAFENLRRSLWDATPG